MRIGLFAHGFPPVIGGGETHVYLVAKALHERGHEVTVITGIPPEHPTIHDPYPFPVIRVQLFREFEAGAVSFRPFLQNVKAALSRFPLDVVHVHNFMPGLAYAVLAPLIRAKTVFTFHSTPVPAEGKIIGLFADWEIEEALARFILKLPFFQVVVCPSRFYASWAKRLGVPRKKIRLVYHGIDADRFRVTPDVTWRQEMGFTENDFVIVCPARMIERKGILDLLEALRRIDNGRVKVYLATSVVRGSPEYWERVRLFIQDHRLESRVKVTVEEENYLTMPRVLANSNALILPSHVEGFGLVLLEGMAAGIPVLGSETYGINEVIRNGVNGLLFQPGNPDDMVAKITRIVTDDQLAVHLVAGGRKSVQGRFALERQIDRLESIYRA